MRIGPRHIAAGPSPYIIAELGVNHDGDAGILLALVCAAHDAGADAVKMQFFDPDLLLGREAPAAAYQRAAGEHDQRSMLRRLALPVDALAKAAALAHQLGMQALLTVFSVPLVAVAEAFDWDAYKVASPDITHRPLLQALMSTGRPIVLSTGAAEIQEIRRAVDWLARARDRLSVLHCVSCYPTPTEHAEVGATGHVSAVTGLCTGYSDHTVRTDTGAAAVLHGAKLLEKHLTLDRRGPGPDHAASLEPSAFAEYVALARSVAAGENVPFDSALAGTGVKRVLPEELDVRRVSRQSIVAARDLAAGETLLASDLAFSRPGDGLEPWRIDEAIGKKVRAGVERGRSLAESDLA